MVKTLVPLTISLPKYTNRKEIKNIYSGKSPEEIARAEGLEVIDFFGKGAGNIREVFIDKTIGLQTGLPYNERQFLIAHALGHYFCHTSSIQLLIKIVVPELVDSQRREAGEFAEWLLSIGDYTCKNINYVYWCNRCRT